MKDWLKKNWLLIILLLIIAFLLLERRGIYPLTRTSDLVGESLQVANEAGAPSYVSTSKTSLSLRKPVAPQPEVQDRLVVEESNISLLVGNVRQKVDEILEETKKVGGYMVSSSLTQPQEAPFAQVVIRVPSDKLDFMMEFLRSKAIKVTSENLIGWDVTDQYVDIEARLATLNKTKVKFEEIMNKTNKVSEILQVQAELINIQTQIDSLKGQQEYLKKTAENAKLTAYLSTDEWALPYAPSEPFRPKAIFKQAVRSLVKTARGLAKVCIWVVVYSVVWLPSGLVILFLKKRKGKMKAKK